jgi:16S rRNA (cytosine967-C5)-methyltransferase
MIDRRDAAPHASRMSEAPTSGAPRLDNKPGLAARDAALRLFHKVYSSRRALDEEALSVADSAGLPPADRALARAIATTAFRHFGSIRAALDTRIDAGWPQESGLLQPILMTAVAQILFMDVADHAAVDLAVSLIHADSRAMRYAKLANAVLRRITREKAVILASREALPRQDLPVWLTDRWARAFGDAAADGIARSFRQQPSIDLSVNSQKPAFDWSRVPHRRLPTGSLRLMSDERIETLPGYAEGAWWVQDAAAALPATLLRVTPGERVLDMCAAPGGKTAQLAAAGANVVALDRSGTRLKRVRENLNRLGLSAEVVEADGTQFDAEPFDAILIDAPCSATGTIRRHPELAWTRTLEDIAKLIGLQKRLLDQAARLLKPGGRLVYTTCSLEMEEGERQIGQFLARTQGFTVEAISPDEIGNCTAAVNADGAMRLLPQAFDLQLSGDGPHFGGVDGFFAARLRLTGA